MNSRSREQEPSRACTRARDRYGPHDDGAAANPFPARGLLGNARPTGPKAESTKGKEINSRVQDGGGSSREERGGACLGLRRLLRKYFNVDFLLASSGVHFCVCPREVPTGSKLGFIGLGASTSAECVGPTGAQGVMTSPVAGQVSRFVPRRVAFQFREAHVQWLPSAPRASEEKLRKRDVELGCWAYNKTEPWDPAFLTRCLAHAENEA